MEEWVRRFGASLGDLRANAYAVNAITGALVWKTKVENHPAARITGAPTLHSGILYVPHRHDDAMQAAVADAGVIWLTMHR
jgi:outer membrane protein assembly factor BamB